MNNPIKTQAQQGMATLVVVIVVLVITTLMVFFATKVGLFDQRMAGNEVRYKEAFATAEAGLDIAVQRFDDQFATNFSGTTSWATVIANSAIAAGTETDGTTAEPGEPSFGVTITNTGGTVYRFSSTGRSADGTGAATVSREVTMKSILGGSAPDVPIIVNGSVGTGGDFNIVANPNGGGNGVPVSIWTGNTAPVGDPPTGNVSMSGSSATCNIQYFDGNNPQCSNPSGNTELISDGDGSTLSAPINTFPDVLPNDPNFPDDLFQFLFGVTRANWQTVYDLANSKHQVAADCSTLSTTSGQKFRLWWITGDCNMGSNQVIGSITDPVILVIDDHQLDMGGGGARVNGVVFLFDNPSGDVATKPSADFHGSPAIYGAMISDVGGTAMNGSYSIVYDPTIMSSLTPGGAVDDGSNYAIAFIPGSWRDF